MDKIKRTERIAALTKILVSRPNEVISFSAFSERFGSAKSTLSEDMVIIDAALRQNGLGQLQTVAGAAGGVRFRPCAQAESARQFLSGLIDKLLAPDRILPGGYLYLSDILGDPVTVRGISQIIACAWYEEKPDFILTMETKGIPVAMMTADYMNVPLVIARRQSKVYEGSAVNINYPGGKGAIETMSLSRRAVKTGQRALIVDDLIRGGGTARGLISLMDEFNVEVIGLSFVLAQDTPPRKPIENEKTLLLFSGGGEDEPLSIRPADWITSGI